MERTAWTDELIKENILEVVKFLGIKRMPSRREIETYFGNNALTGKISKTGGFYSWADKLGLEVKQSETLLGYRVEIKVKTHLEDIGFQCELTSTKHPYDILVGGCVKVDVKAARKTKVHGSEMFSFRLAKQQPTCDIYIAACMNDDQNIERFYVIPAHIMAGKIQLSIGVHHSKYDSYINRWDIVKAYEMAFTEIK